MKKEEFLAKFIEKSILTTMMGNMMIENYTNEDKVSTIISLPTMYREIMGAYDRTQEFVENNDISLDFVDAYLEMFLNKDEAFRTKSLLQELQCVLDRQYGIITGEHESKINVLTIYSELCKKYNSKIDVFYHLIEEIRMAEMKNNK